jgi:SAM-dependent methyltransferase
MTEPANVDPAELAKFSDLAHRWWDPESEFKPLHQINPLRLNWIQGLAPLAGKKVADVGCGGGILADAMARKVPKCWASTSRPSLCVWLSCMPWRPTPRRDLPRSQCRSPGQ